MKRATAEKILNAISGAIFIALIVDVLTPRNGYGLTARQQRELDRERERLKREYLR